VVAVGGHLKNTVAVGKGRDVFLSQHIGDLETPGACDAHGRALADLAELFDVRPEAAARDLHPDYVSSRNAEGMGLPVAAVQHHYAHVAACLAEHGLEGPVLGVSWDGTGLGTDGDVWGGEFLRATLDGFERVAWLRPFRLPGGDTAVREPRRSALGLLYALHGADLEAAAASLPCVGAFEARERVLLTRLMASGMNAPRTTSAGRLFDGVAALLGLRQRSAYEGQAAMALEYAARRAGEAAPLPGLELRDGVLDWGPLVGALCEAVRRGEAAEGLARGFHEALAEAVLRVAEKAGLPDVVLTGGCFQNALLTELAVARLRAGGFNPYWHRLVPPNDGGIALGQAAHAMRRAMNDKET